MYYKYILIFILSYFAYVDFIKEAKRATIIDTLLIKWG